LGVGTFFLPLFSRRRNKKISPKFLDQKNFLRRKTFFPLFFISYPFGILKKVSKKIFNTFQENAHHGEEFYFLDHQVLESLILPKLLQLKLKIQHLFPFPAVIWYQNGLENQKSILKFKKF